MYVTYMRFVGRRALLTQLDVALAEVAASGVGRMIIVRGRRQVGKSRLFTEFLRRSATPHVFFTAIKSAGLGAQLDAFRREVHESTPTLPEAGALFESTPTSWSDVFGRLRLAAQSGPIVVVLDEFPWAAAADPTLEGALQVAWDRHLQHLPILVILIGSDLAMMERIVQHDRPLYGRGREMVVRAFNPAEVSAALGDPGAMKAFDGYLATGGYPKLVDDLARAGSLDAYLAVGLGDENSNMVVVAQRSLAAEFPVEAQARRVLTAIGSQQIGHATFSTAVALLSEGSNGATALTRALQILADDKEFVAIETPSGRDAATRLRRYRVADPYFRFWFRFIEPQLANIARGRSDVAVATLMADWSTWRGMAIEPVVREAIVRLAPSLAPLAEVVDSSAWWDRANTNEVDVVASSAHGRVIALGSIKWRERRQFSVEELEDLAAKRGVVPGAGGAALIAISPAGIRSRATPAVALDASHLLAAWK
jgi:uncharacterized protein